MKRELKILFVILILVVPIISSLSIDVLKENTIAYYVNSNPSNIGGQQYQSSWYLFPRSAQTELLLDENSVEDSYTASWDNSVYDVDKSEVFDLEDIDYAYLYDAVNQKYIQVVGTGTTQEGVNALGDKDVSKYPVIWIFPKENVNKKLFIRIDKEIMPSVEDFTIHKGWNYFFSIPDVLGKKTVDWEGSCEIIKFAHWNDETAQWDDLSVSEFNNIFSETANTLSALAQPVAVKVADDCSFEISPSNSVPAFPD